MNATGLKALNLASSGIELKQFIIRFPPTVEVAGLRVLQLVFNPVGFKLLDSIGDPVRVFGNPFLVVPVGVFLQGIPKFIPCQWFHPLSRLMNQLKHLELFRQNIDFIVVWGNIGTAQILYNIHGVLVQINIVLFVGSILQFNCYHQFIFRNFFEIDTGRSFQSVQKAGCLSGR